MKDKNSICSAVYTVKDLGVLLRLSTRSIFRMRADKKMPPSIKIGGAIRWRKDVIDKWLADGTPPIKN